MREIDINILPLLQKKFGYAGLGYYLELMCELKIKPNHLIEFSELNRLASEMKTTRKKLEQFIECCTQIVTKDGYKLLTCNEKYFWSEKMLVKEYLAKKRNCTKASGRKKLSVENCIKIDDALNVHLTEDQLKRLNNRFGVLLIKNAIKILDMWLQRKSSRAKKYLNKNSYPQFRADSWLIKAAKQLSECMCAAQINTPDGVMLVHKVL